MANGKRQIECEMRNAKCEMKSPVVSGFTKWQIANGKWQIKGLRRL